MDNFNALFGKKVKEARLALAARIGKDVTQEDLADMLGVGFRAVQGWEQGLKFPRPPQLVKLCELTGRDANWFYGIDLRRMAANTVDLSKMDSEL